MKLTKLDWQRLKNEIKSDKYPDIFYSLTMQKWGFKIGQYRECTSNTEQAAHKLRLRRLKHYDNRGALG